MYCVEVVEIVKVVDDDAVAIAPPVTLRLDLEIEVVAIVFYSL